VSVRARALKRAAIAYGRRGQTARALAALAAAGAAREAIRGFERAARLPEQEGALAVLARDWIAVGVPLGARESPAVRQLAARADADAGRFAEGTTGSFAAADGWLARGRTLEAARAITIAVTLALQTGQLQSAIRDAERLHARLIRRDAIAAALVRARIGALRLHAGDPESARRDLDAALRVLPARLRIERAEAEVHRATVEFTAGRWTEFLTRTRRALEQFRRSGYWARAHALLVNMAEAYIYLGEEAVARRHLDEAAALASRSGLHARGLLLELSRARAFSEEGRLTDAGRAFRVARLEAARASTELFDAMLDVWEGVWYRRRGSTKRALQLLTRAAAVFERLESPAWHNVARLERALAAGMAGDTEPALAELAACARVSRRYGDPKEEARVQLFRARVQQHAKLPHADSLKRALRMLDRENYRVLLRKERDVAEPLLAAMPARAGRAAVTWGAASRGNRTPRAGRLATSPGAPATTARVRVQLLGAFAAMRAGVRANPARTSARQLVALLALFAGRPQRREALIEALWPNSPHGAGRNRFDVALHDARRTLDPGAGPRGPFEVLRSENGLVWLDDSVECDLARFDTLADQAVREGTDAALARALAVYTGPLLPEWPDAPWAEDARSRVRSLAESLRLARAHAAFGARMPAVALRFASEILAEDALHEEAVALQLKSLVALGRRGEAAAVCTEYDTRCQRELDSPPGPELVALEHELGIERRGHAPGRTNTHGLLGESPMTQDPIQRLLDEHVELLARLEPLRRALHELPAGGAESLNAALPALREAAQMMTTDLIAHARREDDIFFVAVELAMGGTFGPTTVMRSEHAEIHAGADRFESTLRELQDIQHPAIVDGGARLHEMVQGGAGPGELLAIARPLLDLIDDHFAKEEQVLFPMSRTLLDAASLRKIAEQMDRMDAGS
jgi:DNA-binding SARP family transcriptional activator